MTRPWLETVCLAAVVAILGSATGCGGGPPEPADSDAARSALERALEAWQAGGTPDSLKQEQPPIAISDDQWAAGAKLIKFRIEPGDRPAGADRVYAVTLWFEDKRGKGKQKVVEYIIGTGSTLVVSRSGL